MKDLHLHKLIQKFKKENEKKIDHILNVIDISTDIVIPNSLLFKSENNVCIKKQTKKNHKIHTNELYYGKGILGNVYNLTKSDYNWVMGYIFFKQYCNLFSKSIKCFHVGFGKGGFIAGMNHYFSNHTNTDKHEIEWLGMDVYTNQKFADVHSKNIIHGFKCDNIILHSNLNHAKVIIENTFNKINLLTNNVIPNLKKNKVLVSIAILSITVLHTNGVLITRIPNPEIWDSDFLHYILLFGMIFNNTEICRYPICKKNYIKYRYYLICHNKKHVLHNSSVYRKLCMLLKNNEIEKLVFLQSILETDEIIEWTRKILELQKAYLNSPSNPQDDLNHIINKIKDCQNSEDDINKTH